MPDWLFEGRWQVYAVLGLTALVLLVLWWRDRRRFWVYGVAVLGVVGLLYLLLDFAVETDGEQISRHLQDISQEVRKRDLNKAFSFVADDFASQGMNKRALQDMATSYVRNGTVTEVIIWDFLLVGKSAGPPPVANVEFRIKIKGNLPDELFFDCKADFVKGTDGVWRMRSAQLFNPAHNNEPVTFSP